MRYAAEIITPLTTAVSEMANNAYIVDDTAMLPQTVEREKTTPVQVEVEIRAAVWTTGEVGPVE